MLPYFILLYFGRQIDVFSIEKPFVPNSVIRFVSSNTAAMLTCKDHLVDFHYIDLTKNKPEFKKTIHLGKSGGIFFNASTTLAIGKSNIICQYYSLDHIAHIKILNGDVKKVGLIKSENEFGNVYLNEDNERLLSILYWHDRPNNYANEHNELRWISIADEKNKIIKIGTLDKSFGYIYDGIFVNDIFLAVSSTGLFALKFSKDNNFEIKFRETFKLFDDTSRSPQRLFLDRLRFLKQADQVYSFIYRDYFLNIKKCIVEFNGEKIMVKHQLLSPFWKNNAKNSTAFYNPYNDNLILRERYSNGSLKLFKKGSLMYTCQNTEKICSFDFFENKGIFTTNDSKKNFYIINSGN